LEYDSKCSSKDEAEKKTRLLSFLTIGSLSIKAKLLPATKETEDLKIGKGGSHHGCIY
jgi:hypothetical protein